MVYRSDWLAILFSCFSLAQRSGLKYILPAEFSILAREICRNARRNSRWGFFLLDFGHIFVRIFFSRHIGRAETWTGAWKPECLRPRYGFWVPARAPKTKPSNAARTELYFGTLFAIIRSFFQFLRLSKVLVVMAAWNWKDFGGDRGEK